MSFHRTLFYCGTAVFFYLSAMPAFAQQTTRANLSSGQRQANDQSVDAPSISADGRYVAFTSLASNLVAADTNNAHDIFISDLLTHKTTRISLDANGVQGNKSSWLPRISADGRYVSFSSEASNLVANDTNDVIDVFVYDRSTKKTIRASVSSDNKQGNDNSGWNSAAMSADGRYVAFDSDATNLVAGDTNQASDIFVYDQSTQQTTRASVASNAMQGNNNSGWNSPSMSADGHFVVFDSEASNLVANDTNDNVDVFVYDTWTKQTSRVSLASNDTQGNAWSWQPSVNADGRYVTFESSASNLVSGDSNESSDVFMYDRLNKKTTRISYLPTGVQGNDESFDSSVSADGLYVAFRSYASNLGAADNNDSADIFINDLVKKQVTRVSVASNGEQGNDGSWRPFVSATGRHVAFLSDATNLVAGDSNYLTDVFVADRLLNTAQTSDVKIAVKKKPLTLKNNSTGIYSYTITSTGSNVADVSLLHITSGSGRVISIKPSQGTCTRYSSEILCHLGTLATGKSITADVVMKASNSPVIQQITVTATPLDNSPLNNTVLLSTPVQP